ncbi:hypothetical protein [Campylobacter armoricus]|uniref:hypothetical protein n=1 Tax=Campylobacter armoricus TaxID=2505970 RepID=UPI001FD04EB0|nr:hypothetical protein [Campylobacter armoricus]
MILDISCKSCRLNFLALNSLTKFCKSSSLIPSFSKLVSLLVRTNLYLVIAILLVVVLVLVWLVGLLLEL